MYSIVILFLNNQYNKIMFVPAFDLSYMNVRKINSVLIDKRAEIFDYVYTYYDLSNSF